MRLNIVPSFRQSTVASPGSLSPFHLNVTPNVTPGRQGLGFHICVEDLGDTWEHDVESNLTHRIHGAIYGNMDPINIPPLC